MTKPQWPKEIVVCLGCGRVEFDEANLRRDFYCCTNTGRHGPTQTVSVVPTSEAEGLVEALELIVETPPMPETMREIAKQALAGYRSLQDKGGSGG